MHVTCELNRTKAHNISSTFMNAHLFSCNYEIISGGNWRLTSSVKSVYTNCCVAVG